MQYFNDFAYELNDVVIGSTLPALIYAAQNNFPIITTVLEKPDEFVWFPPTTNLTLFGIEDVEPVPTLRMSEGAKLIGHKYSALWSNLFFVLSMLGLNLTPNNEHDIYIGEDKIIVGQTKFNFKKAHVFSDKNVHGLDLAEEDFQRYRVIDYMKFQNWVKIIRHVDLIETEDKFVSQIYIYDIERCSARVAAVSEIQENDLNDYDFSDLEARFKTQYHISKHVGMNKNLFFLKRTMKSLKKNLYHDTSYIQMHNETVDELLNEPFLNDKMLEEIEKLCMSPE